MNNTSKCNCWRLRCCRQVVGKSIWSDVNISFVLGCLILFSKFGNKIRSSFNVLGVHLLMKIRRGGGGVNHVTSLTLRPDISRIAESSTWLSNIDRWFFGLSGNIFGSTSFSLTTQASTNSKSNSTSFVKLLLLNVVDGFPLE